MLGDESAGVLPDEQPQRCTPQHRYYATCRCRAMDMTVCSLSRRSGESLDVTMGGFVAAVIMSFFLFFSLGDNGFGVREAVRGQRDVIWKDRSEAGRAQNWHDSASDVDRGEFASV
jgi:hypothetical protein